MSIKISSLPSGTVPVDTDVVPAVQGSPLTTYKVTFGQIKTWINSFIAATPWFKGAGLNSAQGGTGTASGSYSIAYGDSVVASGNYAFVYGKNVSSSYDGTFVIGDSTGVYTSPTGTNEFVGTYGNGYYFSISPTNPGVSIDSSGNLKIYKSAKLMNTAGTFSINLSAPGGITANVSFTLPSADAASGNVMVTNGAGQLSLSSAATLQTLTLATGTTATNAFSWDGTNLFFGTNQLLNRSGTVTSNNIAVWNNNGSIKDGGTLGTAAFKTASDNTQTIVASVKGATTANTLPVYQDITGTLGSSTSSSSTPALAAYPIQINNASTTASGLLINGTVSGFNSGAQLSVFSTTAGQTRSSVVLGNSSINVCSLIYDQVNGPVGFSIFFQSVGQQVFNISHVDATANLYYKAFIGGKLGTLTGNTPILTVQATGGASVNQMPLVQIVNNQTPTTQNAAGILMGGTTTATQSFIGTDTINSTGLYFQSNSGSIGKMLTFNNSTGASTFGYGVTAPGLTLAASGASSNALSWNGADIFPYFGGAALIIQNGGITAGNLAVWNGNGQLIDGGSVPPKTFNLVTLTATTLSTYTPTAGTKLLVVEGVGAGGGGGNATTSASTQYAVASGGGAGSYFQLLFTSPAASYSYQCGAGGAGGSAGTNTSFMNSGHTLSYGVAAGGSSGTNITGTTTPTAITLGGNGGDTGLVGNITVAGARGGNSFCLFGLTSIGDSLVSGNGANSVYGRGGASAFIGTVGSSNGNAAIGYGSGGSGAVIDKVTATTTGGAGANGVIYVYEYI